MSEEIKSSNKRDNLPSSAAAVKQHTSVSVASKPIDFTLSKEDIDLLNQCSQSFHARKYQMNAIALATGFFVGRKQFRTHFHLTHPIIYASCLAISSLMQKCVFKNYTETCEEAFAKSALQTPFLQFVRQNGWPEIYSDVTMKFMLKEINAESFKTMKKDFWGNFFSKGKKPENDNENKS